MLRVQKEEVAVLEAVRTLGDVHMGGRSVGQVSPSTLEDIIHCKPGAIEVFLHNLQYKMAKYKASRPSQGGMGDSSSGPRASNEGGGYSDDDDDYSPRQASSAPPSRSAGNNASAASPKRVSLGGNSSSRGGGGEVQQPPAQPQPQQAAPPKGAAASGGRGAGRERRRAFDVPGPTKAGRDALQREVDEEILLEKVREGTSHTQ